MPTRNEVSKIKRDFVDKKKKTIYTKLDGINNVIYDKVISEIIKQSKQQDNYTITGLQSVFKKTFESDFPSIMRETAQASRSLVDLNEMYFSTLVDSNRLTDIKDNINKTINKKLGIDENGKIIKDGFLDKSITTSNAQKIFTTEIKKILTGSPDPVALKEKIKIMLVGTNEINGLLTQYYNTFSKDLINTIDRGNGNIFAGELGLKHFFYGGGLILSSRRFCMKRNGKIFSTEEAKKWKKDPEIIKMYGSKISSYDPLTDMGGYGCLHNPDWITEDLASNIKSEQNKKAAERNAAFKDRNGL